jgi:cell surface protein SprA
VQGQDEFAMQQTHSFTYNTNLGIGYNLTPSINTSFQSQNVFDLARVSVQDAGLTGADSTAFRPTSSMDVFRDLIFDDLSPRRSSYSENYTAGWQPRLSQVRFLDWMTYNARYSGGYRWENSPFGSNQGARVSNTFRLDHTLRLNTESLLNKLPFYRNAAERDRDEQRARQAGGATDENGGYTFGEQVRYYGRRTLLAIFSMRSIDINYSNSKTGSQAGYDGGPRFFDMFGGDSFTPAFGYRLGITERIEQDRLISHPDGQSSIQLPANNTYSDNITLGTRLNPFNNLSVDLNWQTQWDERKTESLTLSPQDEFSSVLSASGNISSSVWAFGGGYEELFRKQLQTAFDGMAADENVITGQESHTVLNSLTLQKQFRSAYLGGTTTVGQKNFTPFPMPSWRVNWTGVEGLIPFAGRFMQRATLTHAYSGLYRVGWNLNNDASEPITRRVGIYRVEDERPEFDPSSVNIEKRFSPLIQLNVTWDNGLRTQIGYETSNITSLSLSNTQIAERISKGLRMQFAYTLRNFRMPFFRALANNVDLTINGSYIEDTERRFLLDADLDRALQEDASVIDRNPSAYSFSPRPPTGQTRINGSAVIGYRFSNTIQANFEYAYSQILPKSSRTFKRTTHDIRFNIRINIRST